MCCESLVAAEGLGRVPPAPDRSRALATYHHDGGVEAAARLVTENVTVYPLSEAVEPPEMHWVSASGKAFNTIHPNSIDFLAARGGRTDRLEGS